MNSQDVAEGEAEGGTDRGSPPSVHKRRRRWPIWSVSQSETMCSICGWTGAHSNVCPFGPEPTKSRQRR